MAFLAPQVSIGFELIPNIQEHDSLHTLQSARYSSRTLSRISEELGSIQCSFSFSASSQHQTLVKEIRQLQPRLEQCEVQVSLKEGLTLSRRPPEAIEIKRSEKSLG
jgi:hypothetical protein